jgi:dipeptidase
MPDAVGGIVWWTNDDPNMAPFSPIYCSVSRIPRCFTKIEDTQDDVTFSWNSAFWVQNTVSNMVYPYYSKIFPDLKAKRDAIEKKNFEDVAELDKALLLKLNNKQTEEAVKKATTFSQNAAQDMLKEWKDLFAFIVVKHNDMVTKKTDDKGNFVKTKYGLSAAPERPGYPEAYRKAIIKETGNKYLMK